MLGAEWLTSISVAGQVGLGLLVTRRGSGTPLARTLALLCYVLAAWNAISWVQIRSPDLLWVATLEASLSPWIVPTAFHVVLAFVGGVRAHARWLQLFYVLFATLSVSTLAGLWWAWSRAWLRSHAWSVVFGALFLLFIVLSIVLLARHIRGTRRAPERMRGRLFLVAFGVGGAFGMTEVLDDFPLGIPAMGVVGGLVTTGILAVVCLRLRLFRVELSTSAALYAVGIAAIGVVAFVSLFALVDATDILALMLVSLMLTGLFVAAMVPAIRHAFERHERTRRLAGLGRFAEQMAHDIKNPLAAFKGSVQFLSREHDEGRPLDPDGEHLALMLDQLERIQIIVDRYQRLGRCEPRLRQVQVNDIVRSVAALQLHAPARDVTLECDLDEDLPACAADPDLVGNAIENLLRNAAEAMPEGGVLTIRTGTRSAPHDPGHVVVTVEDQGVGIDPRMRERVFDEFFTTKAEGSGLGLPFVQRVAQAHGGDVELESSAGAGTRVRFLLAAEHREERP